MTSTLIGRRSFAKLQGKQNRFRLRFGDRNPLRPLSQLVFVGYFCVLNCYSGFPDTLVIKVSKGSEEYWGKVVRADSKTVIFDVECSGATVEKAWHRSVVALNLNSKCKPEVTIPTGGEVVYECGKRHGFVVLDNFYALQDCVSEFT